MSGRAVDGEPAAASPRQAAPTPWRLYLGMTLALVAIVGPALFLLARTQLGAHRRTVEAVAELKARQVEVWLQERLATASFIADARPLGRLYEDWAAGEPEGSAAFVERMTRWGESGGFGEVTLLTGDGRLLWSTGAAHHGVGASRLAALWPHGPARGQVRFAGTGRDDEGRLHLHVAAALNVGAGTSVPVVVGHVSPAELLPPSLRAWPGPRETGRVILLRRDGDRVDALQEPSPDGEAPAGWSHDAGDAGAVVRAVLAADGGRVASRLAPDHRGVWALGAGRRIEGTDWYLLAQVDRAELAVATLPFIASTGTAALLLFGVGLAAVRMLRQRQRLALAEAHRSADRARLRTLGLLQAVTGSSTDAISAKDRHGRYLLFNPAAEAGTGVTAERALGRTDGELFPAEWAESIAAEDRTVLDAQAPRTFERAFAGGGANAGRVVRATKAPLRDADGVTFGVVAVSRDVSEEVAAAEQLRKLSSAVEQSPESIVITDRDARIEYVNDAFVAQTGYAREEVVGRNPSLLNSGKTPASTYRAMWRTLHAGRTWRGEFRNRRKDGSEFDELAIVAPLKNPAGRVTHYLAVKEDVTDRKRMESELDTYRNHLEELVAERTVELAEARERAEAANQAKTTFLTHMSHEIRTPLNAIVGLVHLMRQGGPPPNERERLDRVDTAARHLLAIVDDILDLARIEAGKLQIEDTPFDLHVLVGAVADIVTEEAGSKGVAVRTDLGATPRHLRGDPVRLRQALLNLAGNAVKFTVRGAVTVRARPLECSDGTVRVRLEVEDTGVGMTPDELARVFDAFEQGDTSTTRRHGGTGLGLAITHRLVEAMGGKIDVASAPGRGTTFFVELDFEVAGDPEQEPARSNRRVDPPDVAGARILLAEDHEINREVATELLRAAGAEVEAVADGRAAVERAERGRYDLVLLDVRMPDVDGLQATRMLRALPAYREAPILAMTANVSDEERAACRAAGMDAVVPKPMEPDGLLAALARHLGRDGGRDAVRASDRDRRGDLGRDVSSGAASGRPAPTGPDARLPSLRTVDTIQGLESVGDDVSTYLRLLRRFLAAHRSDADRLAEDLRRKEAGRARDRAHALKGVAGALGANDVAAAAAKLDDELRGRATETGSAANDAELNGLLDDLDRALRQLAAEVHPLADETASRSGDVPSSAGAGMPEAPSARDAADRLMRLLADDDFEAVEEVERHRERLAALVGEGVADAVADAAARLDLPAALARLRDGLRGVERSDGDGGGEAASGTRRG